MCCKPTTVLLAVALMASGTCLAQQANADTVRGVDANADAQVADTAMPAASATAEAPPTDAAAPRPRSAFGKVMAIMISSLERQARDERPAAPVHTSAEGTPLGIEVGEAFLAPSAPPATPSPDYAVRQSALAGPD